MTPEEFTQLGQDARRAELMKRSFRAHEFKLHGDNKSELNEYQQVAALGEPVFAELDAEGRKHVLLALLNFGGGGLKAYRRIAALGEPVFAELDCSGRKLVLAALLNDHDGAPKTYRRAAALGESAFAELDAEGRDLVLFALVQAGIALAQADPGGAIKSYLCAAALGEPVFSELNISGRNRVVQALGNAGAMLAQPPFEDLDGKSTALRRATALGESVFAELDAKNRSVLFYELHDAASRGGQFNLKRSKVQSMVLMQLLLPALTKDDVDFGPLAIAFNQIQEMPFLACWPTALEASKWWLANFCAFPTQAERPNQRRQVIRLSSALANQYLHNQQRRHRQCLSVTVPAKPEATFGWLSDVLSKWAAGQVRESFDEAGPADRPEAFLLARLRAARKPIADWPAAAPWRLDLPALYRDLNIDGLFHDDGFLKAAHAWPRMAGDSRLTWRNFGESCGSNDQKLADAVRAWRDNDSSLAVSILEASWQHIECSGHSVGNEWIKDLDALTTWLVRLGKPLEDARTEARDALIYRDIAEVLQQAFRRWIDGQLESCSPSAETESVQVLNGIFRNLLTWLPLPTTEAAICDRLHTFLTAQIEASSSQPPLLWTALETQRFAVASAVALQTKPSAPDAQAIQRLQDTFSGELADLTRRIARVQSGEADDTPSLELNDITFSLFDVLSEELERLGHTLKLPDQRSCADALRPGEHLVQIWFSSNGGANALVLSAKEGLRNEPLPTELDLSRWEDLLVMTEQARERSTAAWWHTNQMPIQSDEGNRPWLTFVAPDSPATVLLHTLRGLLGAELNLGRSSVRCTLILPARLVCLPWLARAVSGTEDGKPDFTPGEFVLEASVSSWLQTCSTASNDADTTAPGQVVYIDQEDNGKSYHYGLAEAKVVARALNTEPVAASGMVELVRALQASGPAHLAVHGEFSPFDPLCSFLAVNGDGKPDLPAWLLAAMAVRGDISLACCQSMLVGHGKDQQTRWAGPVGVGPLLRACGARCVIGPLGLQNRLASLLFFSLWFEARRELPAVQALAEAQKALREMTVESAKQRIRQIDPNPQLRDDAHNLKNMAKASGWGKHPFRNPDLWAQFTLLGDAPALPVGIRGNAELSGATRNLTSWIRRIWQQLFRERSSA